MKRKLIILFSLLGFIIVSTISIFAAFSFFGNVDGTAESGKINVISKNYIEYTIDPNTGAIIERLLADDINMVTCYATEKKGYDEEKAEYFQLKDLGFRFTFKTDIDVCVRIHVRDAWISHKVYNNGSIVENYISKDKLESGSSPFTVPDGNWYYDEATGYAYLKNIVESSDDEHSYTFITDRDYFYEPAKANGFREAVLVETSFIVDIVQANRTEQKWGVKLGEILN